MNAIDVQNKTFIGNKDFAKGHFSVLQEIFSIKKSVGMKNDDKERFKNILKAVMSCGDYGM